MKVIFVKESVLIRRGGAVKGREIMIQAVTMFFDSGGFRRNVHCEDHTTLLLIHRKDTDGPDLLERIPSKTFMAR